MERRGGARTLLWYRVPAADGIPLTEACDPFVVAVLFAAMEDGEGLRVHGETAPSLLRNLEEFQAAWVRWLPARYRRVEIVADLERERPAVGGGALAAFSGGLDSCFTVFRHATGRAGRLTQRPLAGLMVHGFDIPLEEPETFANAAARSATLLKSLGIPLHTMTTNFRELRQEWQHSFAAAAASCLMLHQTTYRTGLLGSAEPYDQLILPLGSNPITDGWLSSDSFRMVHDGAAFSRVEKAREVARWPAALELLRVCWAGAQKDRNCGRCEKCLRTILDFRVVGVGLPPAFDRDVSDRDILRLRGLNDAQINEFLLIFQAAEKAGMKASWVRALKRRLRRNRIRSRISAWDRRYLRGMSRRSYVWICGWRERAVRFRDEVRRA